MKRFLILSMVLGLVAGSVATAEAKKSRQPIERTVVGTYGSFPAPVTGCNSPLGTYACMIVETRSGERFLAAKVTDTHGQPVFVEVRVFKASTLAGFHTFCGETERPIRFVPGSSLEFDVGLGRLGALDCPTNRVKTTGTISVTLSNLP